jgi:DNA-binding Lrp family transcriptional regulator
VQLRATYGKETSTTTFLFGDHSSMSPAATRRRKNVRPVDRAGATLDELDHRLLQELAADARVPNNALAERLGIAPSTCSLRLRRLREVGAIRGFHADVAPEAIGLPIQAMVAVRVQPSARARIGELTGKLAALPGVINVYFLAGAVDFLVQVAAASPDDLRDFVTTQLSASREIAQTETSLVFEHMRGSLPE